jgi:DNA polymerase V
MTMLHQLTAEKSTPVRFYDIGVSAGFPSPADDYKEKKLDLNDLLIRQPEATFFAKASGDSMTGAGIFDGDMLIVDRSITAADGKIVIAVVNGELTVKRFKLVGRTAQLHAENPKYSPITLCEGDNVNVWGVVTNVIHSMD